MVDGLLGKLMEADIFKPASAKDVKARDAEKEAIRKKERDEAAKTMFVCPYCDEPLEYVSFVSRPVHSVQGRVDKEGNVTDFEPTDTDYHDDDIYEDPECPDCGHSLSKDVDW